MLDSRSKPNKNTLFSDKGRCMTNIKNSIVKLVHNSTFYSSTVFKCQKHKNNYKSMGMQYTKMQFVVSRTKREEHKFLYVPEVN